MYTKSNKFSEKIEKEIQNEMVLSSFINSIKIVQNTIYFINNLENQKRFNNKKRKS
jgi:hypothetical protein